MNLFDIKDEIMPTMRKLVDMYDDLIYGKLPDILKIRKEAREVLLKYMDTEIVEEILDKPLPIYCRLTNTTVYNYHMNKSIIENHKELFKNGQ